MLDASLQPSKNGVYGWVVGRGVDVDISLINIMVSKHHARIMAVIDKEATAETGTPQYRWTIEDTLSSNRTFLDGYACAPGVEYEINEAATIQFGTDQAMVRCSFDLDDTDRVVREAMDEGTISGDNQDAATNIPEKPATTTWPDVAMAILNGPPGIDKRLWWVLIGAGVAGYFWLIQR